MAKYRGKGKWFPGTIVKVVGSGTRSLYDVLYDDGDTDSGLREEFLQLMEGGRAWGGPMLDGQRSVSGHWAPKSIAACQACAARFHVLCWRHHCRVCGGLFCDDCAPARRVVALPVSLSSSTKPVRVCNVCMELEVSLCCTIDSMACSVLLCLHFARE